MKPLTTREAVTRALRNYEAVLKATIQKAGSNQTSAQVVRGVVSAVTADIAALEALLLTLPAEDAPKEPKKSKVAATRKAEKPAAADEKGEITEEMISAPTAARSGPPEDSE